MGCGRHHSRISMGQRKIRNDDTIKWAYGYGTKRHGSPTINSATPLGRAYARINTVAAGENEVVLDEASTFVDGSLVVIIQMTSTGIPGEHEFAKVISGGGTTVLVLDQPLQNNYVTNGYQKAQIVEFSEFNELTLAPGGLISVPSWNGEKGAVGAIFGRRLVQTGGSLDASGKGLRAGLGTSDPGGGDGGEGLVGKSGRAGWTGGSLNGISPSGGGGGNPSVGGGAASGAQYYTGGGGGGSSDGNNGDESGGGGGGGGHYFGGGGGAGGCDQLNGTPSGVGGASNAVAGGGSGGGGSAGPGGSGRPGGASGQAGDGGAPPVPNGYSGNGGNGQGGAGDLGGGGGGGANIPVSDLQLKIMLMGGGGGAGGRYSQSGGGAGGHGGNGGGLLFVFFEEIVLTGGEITVDGKAGNPGGGSRAGGGGGGAAGSILFKCRKANFGSNLVRALGGAGYRPQFGGGGGQGSRGIIHVDYSESIAGTTTPDLDSRQDLAVAPPSAMWSIFSRLLGR